MSDEVHIAILHRAWRQVKSYQLTLNNFKYKCKYEYKYTCKYKCNRKTYSQQPNTMPGHLGEADDNKDARVQGSFSPFS